MRACLIVFWLLAPIPALAQTDDHGGHLAEVDGLRVLHVWTPATPAGSDALIYLEIENLSGAEVVLTGATAMGQKLDLVGFSYGAAGESWRVLPGLPVPSGAEIKLEPQILALRWTAVPVDLVQGADLDVEVAFGGRVLQAEAEIGAGDATAHSHAGHSH